MRRSIAKLMPEVGLVFRHDGAVFHNRGFPLRHFAVTLIIVPRDLKFRYVAALRFGYRNFLSVNLQTGFALAVLEADGRRRLGL